MAPVQPLVVRARTAAEVGAVAPLGDLMLYSYRPPSVKVQVPCPRWGGTGGNAPFGGRLFLVRGPVVSSDLVATSDLLACPEFLAQRRAVGVFEPSKGDMRLVGSEGEVGARAHANRQHHRRSRAQ
jgi:hypothetical protein